ncbi:MAG: hypothetical protein ACKOJG_03360 [Actinomycetota bacterium]
MTPGGSRLLTRTEPIFARALAQTLRPTMAGILAALLAVSVVVMPADAAGDAKAPKKTLLVLGDSLTWGANYFAKTQSRLTATGQFAVVPESEMVDALVDWANYIHEHGVDAALQRVDTTIAEREAARDRSALLDEQGADANRSSEKIVEIRKTVDG